MKLATNDYVNRLLDCYEKMLTKTQLEIMNLYYREDWSLQEISAKLKVSRNSVHTTIKRVKLTLASYETKLGMIDKELKIDKVLKDPKLNRTQIIKQIDKIING